MKPEALFAEAEVELLLARDEGQFLEFKSLWDRSEEPRKALDRRKARDFIAEHVAAFANSDGGTLILGVDDDGTPSGHGYPDDTIEEFFAVPDRRLRPSVACRVQRRTIAGHELILFEVPIGVEAVMVDGNGFPYRVGDRVIREPQEIINSRKTAYRRLGFEQRTRPEATLDDVDLELAARFLSATPFRGRPAEELLRRYGLAHPKSGSLALTNACLLLFGKSPTSRWHPRAGIRLFKTSGSDREHGARRNVTQIARIDPPLAAALSETQRVAREHIRRSEKLHDLFFREMPEYPTFAWQEAIVNAVAHRDYEDQSREIEIWFYDDRMEVKSPGEPIPPVTLDSLRSRQPVHASRNPLLVRVLADVGIMREEGEGIPRIFDEMESSYLAGPEFRTDASDFTVTLRNEPIFSGPSTEWQDVVRALPLAPSQRRMLLAHPGGFTNADYQRLGAVDRDQAYREIQDMVAQGVILPAESHGRGAVYRLAPHLHEAQAFLQARLPQLRELLLRRPFLKNADYRVMFGLTRVAALRELTSLSEHGYLKREGERRGARYLPGPALRAGTTE
ncbi:MAG: ATP-binding protein [Planctomycetota bacterium]